MESSAAVTLNGRLHGHLLLLLLSPVLFRMLQAGRTEALLVLSQLPVGSIRVDWHRVSITLVRDSLRPSLVLFSCCAASLAFCSFRHFTFQWGLPCCIFRCIFWDGIIHFWWRALICTWKLGWKIKLYCYRAITSLELDLHTCRTGGMCVKGHITIVTVAMVFT